MSSSPRASAWLIVRGAIGVELRIIDGNYQAMARGTVELRAQLPEGVYMVDWTAAGRSVRKVVRLLPVAEPLVVWPDPAPPASLLDDLPAALPVLAGDDLSSPEADHGAEIVLVLRDDDPDGACADKAIRLLNQNEEEATFADDVALHGETGRRWLTRCYRVAPGDYSLRYIDLSGDTLTQTVPAMSKRRTVIIMRLATGTVLELEGQRRQAGVDPAGGVIFSLPPAGDSDLREAARLAEILLHDLATGRCSLGRDFATRLDARHVDPLLRLYAAMAALRQLERGLSPALDEPMPDAAPGKATVSAAWLDRSAGWLTRRKPKGAPPDFNCALWRLEKMTGRPYTRSRRLKSPPMTERAWVWAAARSAIDPLAIPNSVSFAAISESAGGQAPWLCWRNANAKGSGAALGRAGDLPALVRLVADQVGGILGSTPTAGPNGPEAATSPLAVLPTRLENLALRAHETQEKFADAGPGVAATMLAQRLGTPAGALARDLGAIHEALAAHMNPKALSHDLSAPPPDSRAPALRRRVINADDPNKGRFGGQSAHGPFRLEAAFAPTKSKNWIRVELAIQGLSAPDGAKAQIFLHDSFHPRQYELTFLAGVAQKAVTCWGGFTVGAWIPSSGVELELDLAQIPNAPRIIKSR